MRYFTYNELCRSNVAMQKGIANVPYVYGETHVYQNLATLVEKLLDPIREQFAVPMIVTSGYRCHYINELVGGKIDSQHRTGKAVDFYFAGFNGVEMMEAFFEIGERFDFDQLIYYKRRHFIHISYNGRRNRHQSFII